MSSGVPSAGSDVPLLPEDIDIVMTDESDHSARPLGKAELLAIPIHDLTPSLLATSLDSMRGRDSLLSAGELLHSGKVSDISSARVIVDLAMDKGSAAWTEAEVSLLARLGRERVGPWEDLPVGELSEAIGGLDEDNQAALRSWTAVQVASQRLASFEAIWPSAPSSSQQPDQATSHDEASGSEGIEVDDPWAEAEAIELDDPWEAGSTRSTRSARSNPAGADHSSNNVPTSSQPPPVPLSKFLTEPISVVALELASSASLEALSALRKRHPAELFPYRLSILEAIPAWVPPAELHSANLLPSAGEDGKETTWPTDSILTLNDVLRDYFLSPPPDLAPRNRLTADELSTWYEDRLSSLDKMGLLDLQLGWVQHAASLSVPSLDSIGEDLSLLSRLVYDSDLTPIQQSRWTLYSWRSSSPSDIVSAYLSNSTSKSIVPDIRRLVLPYLYVLESRAERSGQPDADVVNRLLYEVILGLPLHLALPVFEASKATLPKSERVVADDMAVARLALACLYGSDQRNVWATMSSIFECLPVWELSGANPEDDSELTSTTLDSIAAFVRPSVTSPKPPRAKDLFVFFQPLPFASLSRALDILDVHLESGEALARWDVPVQLRFLLQSARDAREQAELAEKMVRRAAAGASGGIPATSRGGAGTDEARWNRLWEDMIKLNGSGDALLRGAFGMIRGDEMMRIYLGGLLRSGKFDVARKMVRRLEAEHGLSTHLLEEIVLDTSRELYENAENGNIHTGEMKLAYDCLTVASASPAIHKEREFIEATSRLTSFSVTSPRSGGQMSPVEIRHTKNKLDLVRLVLRSSKDAYKHDELMLDLADKLGYRGDPVARGEVLGMLAESATLAGEWDAAYDHVQGAVEVARDVHKRLGREKRKSVDSDRRAHVLVHVGEAGPSGSTSSGASHSHSHSHSHASTLQAEDARVRDVAWRTALDLGTQQHFSDVARRQTLLGWAVELAPASHLHEILPAWRSLEDGAHRLSAAAKRRRVAGITTSHARNRSGGSAGSMSIGIGTGNGGRGVGVGSGTEERVLGSRTAARAARMARDLGDRWGIHSPLGISSPRLGGLGAALARTTSRDSTGSTRSARERPGSTDPTNPTRAIVAAESGSARWDRERGEAAGEGAGAGATRSSLEGESDRPIAAALGGLGEDDVERVRRGARRALVKGVGWLLGAEESEIA